MYKCRDYNFYLVLTMALPIISSLIHFWYCGIYDCCSYFALSFHMEHREIVEGSRIIMSWVHVAFVLMYTYFYHLGTCSFLRLRVYLCRWEEKKYTRASASIKVLDAVDVFDRCIDNIGQSNWTRSYFKYYIAAICLIQVLVFVSHYPSLVMIRTNSPIQWDPI